jgi:hypothetical protein
LLQKRKKEEEEFEEKISEQLERFFNNDTESSKNVIDYRYEICRILGHTGKQYYLFAQQYFVAKTHIFSNVYFYLLCDATA